MSSRTGSTCSGYHSKDFEPSANKCKDKLNSNLVTLLFSHLGLLRYLFPRFAHDSLHAFPRSPLVISDVFLHFSLDSLHAFQRLFCVTCFPALSSRYMFPRAFPLVKCFPALSLWLHVFPRFPLDTCFPPVAFHYMFSRAFLSIHAFPWLPLVICFSRAFLSLHLKVFIVLTSF